MKKTQGQFAHYGNDQIKYFILFNIKIQTNNKIKLLTKSLIYITP